MRSRTAQLALAGLCALLAASAAFGASSRNHAGALGVQSQNHASRAQRALLDVYALDSRLESARSRVTSLETAAVSLRHERVALRRLLAVTRATLTASQQEFAVRLRALYEEGTIDPVSVVLGASSLGKGLRQLDSLNRLTEQSRQVVAAAHAARLRLLHTRRSLSAAARNLARSLASARAAEGALASAAAARTAYVASLRSRVGATQATGIVASAHKAAAKSQKLQPSSPSSGGRKLTVSATCYDLSGRTATGMPVGWGVVAVDPSVIPLGTKLYIPGYGQGVAADVGGGIKGAIIDLWMPYSKCMQWGRRTVTITIY